MPLPVADRATEWPVFALALLVGLAIGSFLNVCIHRLPAGLSVVWPGSRCPSCETALAWWAWAVGAVESISQEAERLAAEVERTGSPIFGLFDPERMREAAGKLGDAGMNNTWPRIAVNDPLAGLPRPVKGAADETS